MKIELTLNDFVRLDPSWDEEKCMTVFDVWLFGVYVGQTEDEDEAKDRAARAIKKLWEETE